MFVRIKLFPLTKGNQILPLLKINTVADCQLIIMLYINVTNIISVIWVHNWHFSGLKFHTTIFYSLLGNWRNFSPKQQRSFYYLFYNNDAGEWKIPTDCFWLRFIYQMREINVFKVHFVQQGMIPTNELMQINEGEFRTLSNLLYCNWYRNFLFDTFVINTI